MSDDVSLPDRSGVRTPMQWTGEGNAGFSTAERFYAPVVNPDMANVAAQQADPNSLLHAIRRMIAARKRLPVLAQGDIHWNDNLPKHILYFWRTPQGQRLNDPSAHTGTVLAVHNLSDQPVTIPVPVGLRDALDADVSVGTSVELPAFGYRWLMA
jgi:maltose alpha-D-glucosyltransferase/alpha-amylase